MEPTIYTSCTPVQQSSAPGAADVNTQNFLSLRKQPTTSLKMKRTKMYMPHDNYDNKTVILIDLKKAKIKKKN